MWVEHIASEVLTSVWKMPHITHVRFCCQSQVQITCSACVRCILEAVQSHMINNQKGMGILLTRFSQGETWLLEWGCRWADGRVGGRASNISFFTITWVSFDQSTSNFAGGWIFFFFFFFASKKFYLKHVESNHATFFFLWFWCYWIASARWPVLCCPLLHQGTFPEHHCWCLPCMCVLLFSFLHMALQQNACVSFLGSIGL